MYFSSKLSVRRQLCILTSALFLAWPLVSDAAPVATGAAGGAVSKNVTLAVSTDNAYELRSLLKKGANPNSRTPDRGETPLMMAVREDARQSFKVLLDTKGVDLNARAKNGDTAMMLAALAGQADKVKALLDKEAEPNNTGWTALHYAALNGHNDIVSMLIEASAYIDAESPNKTTPLMMAARGGKADTIRLLLEQGADPKIKNEVGLTAADYATRAGHSQIAAGLRQVEAGQPFSQGIGNDAADSANDTAAPAKPAAKPVPAKPLTDPSLPLLDQPLRR